MVSGASPPSRASISAPIRRSGSTTRPIGRRRIDASPSSVQVPPPRWPASQPVSRRMSVPALPTSMACPGSPAARRPGPRSTRPSSRSCTRTPSAWTARSVDRVSSAGRKFVTCTGSDAMAASSAARCDSDLSAGAVSVPRRRGAGRKKRRAISPRTTGCPSASTSASASRAAGSPAIQRATTPLALSGAGCRAMSTMLTDARPRASATSATTPGRLGTGTRSSTTSSPSRWASSRRRRSSPAASFQAATAAASPARRASRTAARRAIVSSSSVAERVGVGEVDVAPDRGRRPGDPGGVAEARARVRQALALGVQRARRLGDQDVGQHVREVTDRGHQACRACRRPAPAAARRARPAAGAAARSARRRCAPSA